MSVSQLGVPTTSQILTGDCQNLSFSTLTKVPFLIFWSDKLPCQSSSAQLACSTKLSRQARQSLCVEGHCLMSKFFTFLKSLQKVVRYMYQPAQFDEKILKPGTPNRQWLLLPYSSSLKKYTIWNTTLSEWMQFNLHFKEFGKTFKPFLKEVMVFLSCSTFFFTAMFQK